MRLRLAQARDAPALSRLLEQLGYHTTPAGVARRLTRLESDPAARALVAEVAGEVAGLATLRVEHLIEHEQPFCRLTALVVDERRRGTGIGAALTAAVEEEARRRDCAGVVLTSADRRTDAHAFYRRLGYHDTGRRFVKSLVD